MLGHFDIVALPDGSYELVNGHAVTKVTFDNDAEQAMFAALVETRKSPSAALKAMIRDHGREAVYAFCLKLRDARLISFENETGLLRGEVGDGYEALRREIAALGDRSIGLISASALGDALKAQPVLKKAERLDLARRNVADAFPDFIARHELVVFDASAASPSLLSAYNRAAIARSRPWLLVQGMFEGAGHVGPLFMGSETGCYDCFRARLRSNAAGLASLTRYENWLDETGRLSRAASIPSASFLNLVAAVAAMEIEKFLTGFDLAQSFGYLLDINMRTYSVTPHRLYKAPFCETCAGPFEDRTAPWLDAITLGPA
jgi:bacteriocin biosynthesis cyclodehydratase domain-containing protein